MAEITNLNIWTVTIHATGRTLLFSYRRASVCAKQRDKANERKRERERRRGAESSAMGIALRLFVCRTGILITMNPLCEVDAANSV